MDPVQVLHLKKKIVSFAESIGLKSEYRKGVSGFVPGVLIENGVLVYDFDIADISALLHEFGHLAITPPEFRNKMSGNLMAGMREMFDSIESLNIGVESPLYKAILQCSDPEATAWGFALGVHLGVPKSLIINKKDYDGEGDFVLMALDSSCYLGINGLSASGFCYPNKSTAEYHDSHPYPAMLKWVHESGLDSFSPHAL